MKKYSALILLFLCTALFIGGTAVAYCNTRNVGFESDAKWITYTDTGFTVYDFQVKYRWLEERWERISKFFSKKSQTCLCGKMEFQCMPRADTVCFSLPVYNVYK